LQHQKTKHKAPLSDNSILNRSNPVIGAVFYSYYLNFQIYRRHIWVNLHTSPKIQRKPTEEYALIAQICSHSAINEKIFVNFFSFHVILTVDLTYPPS